MIHQILLLKVSSKCLLASILFLISSICSIPLEHGQQAYIMDKYRCTFDEVPFMEASCNRIATFCLCLATSKGLMNTPNTVKHLCLTQCCCCTWSHPSVTSTSRITPCYIAYSLIFQSLQIPKLLQVLLHTISSFTHFQLQNHFHFLS